MANLITMEEFFAPSPEELMVDAWEAFRYMVDELVVVEATKNPIRVEEVE